MPMKWVHKEDFFGPDAYIDWVLGAARDFGQKYTVYDVLIRMAGNYTLQNLAEIIYIPGISSATSIEAMPFKFEVSGLFARNFVATEVSHFTACVDDAFFVFLNTRTDGTLGKLRDLLGDIVLGQELPADARRPQDCGTDLSPIQVPLSDEVVVIGIIDEGIAFGHERFRTADGRSRVEYVWLQDAAYTYCTDGVEYGRELAKHGFIDAPATAPGLDALLRKYTKDGQFLDEDGFYREAGLVDFGRSSHNVAAKRVSHGTHVMDLACGYAPEQSRMDRPVICVQLPSATVADTSGIGLQKFMLDAVAYIFSRAARITQPGKPPRLVINFSSGMRAGPHDGASAIESALDQLITYRTASAGGGPTAVVLPAGNSHLVRGHARFDLDAGVPHDLTWRVSPDDRTSSYLEIWLPADSAGADLSKVDLKIGPPGGYGDGKPLSSATDRRAVQWEAEGGRVVCKAYFENRKLKHYPSTGGVPIDFVRGRFLVALLPTAYHDAPGPLAPAGEWRLTLTYTGRGTMAGVHAWIHWDDRPIGYPRVGRQSYFDDENYQRFQYPSGRDRELDVDPTDWDTVDTSACYVRRATTLNAIATGAFVVTVGGHRRKDMKPAKYSSIGPALAPPTQVFRTGPDATAVTDESIVTGGILAAGSRDGTCVAMNGTSVAAPQVARLVADEFAKGAKGGNRKRNVLRSPREIVGDRAGNDDQLQAPDSPGEQRIGRGRLRLDPHLDTPAQRHRQPKPEVS